MLVSAYTRLLLCFVESNAAVAQGYWIIDLWPSTLYGRLHDEGQPVEARVIEQPLEAVDANQSASNVCMPVPAGMSAWAGDVATAASVIGVEMSALSATLMQRAIYTCRGWI